MIGSSVVGGMGGGGAIGVLGTEEGIDRVSVTTSIDGRKVFVC